MVPTKQGYYNNGIANSIFKLTILSTFHLSCLKKKKWRERERERERERDYIAVILNINFGKEFKDDCFNTFAGMRLGEAHHSSQ